MYLFSASVGGVATLQGSPVTRNGKEYMNLDTLKFSISVQHAQIQMNNLFNGNKELGKVAKIIPSLIYQ